MPDPREPDFLEQAAERIRRVLEITRGRAFCLFTSYAQMRAMHERLIAELPYPLLLQGTAPRTCAAAAVSRYARRRALWDFELLAGSGRAGRATQLRHHRPAARSPSRPTRL